MRKIFPNKKNFEEDQISNSSHIQRSEYDEGMFETKTPAIE